MQLDLAEFARMAVWLHWNGLRMTINYTPIICFRKNVDQ